MAAHTLSKSVLRDLCEVEFLGGVFLEKGATAYLMWAAYHASLPDS